MQKKKSYSSGVKLDFEAKLWLTADKLRNNMDAAECKRVVLGLIFLKYISDAFGDITVYGQHIFVLANPSVWIAA